MSEFQNQGWIKIHRKSMESSVWKNPTVWWVWSWCLMKASHQESKFPFNGSDMIIERGQFVTGREKACMELRLTSQKYRTAIEYLKSTQRITTKTTNKFTVITVINWDKYQVDNQQNNQSVTNQQPTNNQPITTYKNVKNVKNVKNDKKELVKNYSLEDKNLTDLLYKLIKQNYPFLKDKDYSKDYEEMNKINRIDKWEYKQIEFIINWSQNDDFWKQNIRSVSKLRKQFETLVVKAKENNNQIIKIQ